MFSLISDRVKMYTHRYMNPDVDNFSLQRKVQFDIRFFFTRRGSENMHKMRKNDFQLSFDQRTESWFVKKIHDELTKNHCSREQIVTGYMPENRDDPLCPVASFKKYQDHLNVDNPYLWQKALENGCLKNDKNIWYSKQHIGRNTLAKFMSEVSKKCDLSKMYSNHSIRATGITVLTRMNYSNSQDMAISGHKSVQSLSIYQKNRTEGKAGDGQCAISVSYQARRSNYMVKSTTTWKFNSIKSIASDTHRACCHSSCYSRHHSHRSQ